MLILLLKQARDAILLALDLNLHNVSPTRWLHLLTVLEVRDIIRAGHHALQFYSHFTFGLGLGLEDDEEVAGDVAQLRIENASQLLWLEETVVAVVILLGVASNEFIHTF